MSRFRTLSGWPRLRPIHPPAFLVILQPATHQGSAGQHFDTPCPRRDQPTSWVRLFQKVLPMYLLSASSDTAGLISRATTVSVGEDPDLLTASTRGDWDVGREGFMRPSFPSWLAFSSSSSNLFKRRNSSTLVVLDPPVLPLGNRARFGKTQGRLDRSHAAHGLVLLHFTLRFRQLVQLSR